MSSNAWTCPVTQYRTFLGRERLGIQVAGGPHHGDEQLGPQQHLPGLAVPDRDGVAGEIDEQLLPRPVDLAHDDVDLASPGPVQVAELAVAVPARGLLPGL